MSTFQKYIPLLKGRGLFIFSDPGGAKPILALLESIQSNLSAFKIISDRTYSFYKDFSFAINKPTTTPIDEIDIFCPDFVFTGTSYTSNIELQYIKAANESSITSYSFVDHWTSVRERFNDNGHEVLPDLILVVDEGAKGIALNQGLSEDIINVFGNPYHEYLKKWRPKLSKEEFMISLGLAKQQKKIVVYAPDPLSNINGKSIYGFDEISATKKLNELIENTSCNYLFIVNPHPNQNIEALTEVLSEKAMLAPVGTDVNTLIFYADIVIGFFSSFLIEASIMNKKVIRLLSQVINNDPLAGKLIGEVAYPETIAYLFNQIT